MPSNEAPQTRQITQRSFSSNDLNAASQSYTAPVQVLSSQGNPPFRSLRTRRAQQNAALPLHIRRRAAMEEDSWLQSISDWENGPQSARHFLHGQDQGRPFDANSQKASQSAPNCMMPIHGYSGNRLGTLNSSSSYHSPAWSADSQHLGFDGVAAGPMTSTWPQSTYNSMLPDSSISLPSTPSAFGPYQSHFHDQGNRQMPHLNTPPTSAISFSKMGHSGGSNRSNLRADNGTHGYFKENGSEIMKKWFGNTTNPIAPPQLYNVPPPASLSSQDSFNDAASTSAKRLRLSTPNVHPGSSDLSSQPSLSTTSEGGTQSPLAETCSRRRLPNTANRSPAPLTDSDYQASISYESPNGNMSVAHSVYESDSNYATSSVRSCQPSRLPSPADSEIQRSAQNNFLIEARASGMSYKEIKAKGGFTEAESTLRGRHRMLTKDKESRVRRPVWTDTDVELLKKAVKTHTRGGTRNGKTSWKKVAEFITNNGGSYSFAYATCHNKWKELQPRRR